MKTSKGFAKLSRVIAMMTACLAASGAAAADLAQEPPLCRGGILTNATTGQPVFDPSKKDREPIRCGPPPVVEAESLDPMLVAGGGVLAAGLGVGICAAAGCFKGPTSPTYPILPASP